MESPRLTPKKKLTILIWDFFIYQILFYLAFQLRLGNFETRYFLSPGSLFTVAVLLLFSYILGTYDVDELRGRELFKRLVIVVILSALTIIFVNFLLVKQRAGIFGRGVLLSVLFGYLIFSSALRLAYRRRFKNRANKNRWLILCDSTTDKVIAQDNLQAQLRGQFKVVDIGAQTPNQIEMAHGYVVAANSNLMTSEWKDFLLDIKMEGRIVITWADFIESNLRKIPVEHIEVDWFFLHSGYGLITSLSLSRVKRLHDLALSVILLILTFPLMLLTAIAVKLDSRGPVFYSQNRTGLRGRTFRVHKFRSMRTDAEAGGHKWASANDSRITRVGAFIRKTRLDELPQLVNVFRGEMSLIGPRPERPEFNEDLEKQIPYYNLRHLVRPGLTGWAQILYPYGASVTDSKNKLEYDLFYIKNYSFVLDYLILLRTVKIVFFGQGR